MKNIFQSSRRSACAALLLLLLTCSVGWTQNQKSTSEIALRSLLNQRGAKRGLFLQEGKPPGDQVKNKDLQIAFVIDGTDSMGSDIYGVQDSIDSFVTSFKALQEDDAKTRLEFSVIVYRDKRSGDVEIVQQDFTQNIGGLKKKISEIETKTGYPAFEELMDVGIYTALNSLDWSGDKNTVKWIVVFGDAPPYRDSDIKIGDYLTGRMHSDKDLTDAAKALDVSLNFVLCNSGFKNSDKYNQEQLAKLKEIYEQSVPETRQFMSSMAKATDGFVFDLSDEKKILELAKAAAQEFIEFKPITPEDVRETRISLMENIGTPVRIGVLPHVSRDRFKNWINDDEADLGALAAVQLTRKLNLPGLLVSSRSEVREAMRSIDLSEPTADDALLVELGRELSTDYVAWGQVVDKSGTLTMTSSIYSTLDGTVIASAESKTSNSSELGRNNLVGTVAEKLLRDFQNKVKSNKQASLFVSTFNREAKREVRRPYGKEYRVSEKILKGLDYLEKSVEFKVGDSDALSVLKKARLQLKSALQNESDNVHAHLFLASCLYNLERADSSNEADGEVSDEFKTHLTKAYQLREDAVTNDIMLEIEADHALFVEQNVDAAIRAYKSIINNGSASEKSLKRANWMLAGIYAGEWGAGSIHQDLDKSRKHIMNILARYESSAEAKFFKKQFNWDDTNGTENPEIRASEYRLASYVD